ncbi:MAG: DUF2726 domain-containing protein [Leptothrix sp. (in: Bacteria)]|jgi:hypothetical protein|nr:DUF2726 domain-containing protein [Leptothrix sp. (in: b-proteobacteria)]MBP7519364.1 DUF2726 domain-containing protein [Leptothrix sp. (in: b-proteobacteria)]HQY07798.1 DUF2726 domain-containing protein [Burkholderiaceae bacterium]
MPPIPAWFFAVIAAAAVAGLVVLAMRRSGSGKSGDAALPEDWPLIQRAIFSAEERTLYRQLRSALPHHTILAKVPLVRFCQPIDRDELGYWFKLLGPIHVSFVVCADNGRVLAALDIERPSRPTSKRVATIRQSVLEACRIRYVKCRSDQLPTAAELQLLVPQQGEMSKPLVPAHVQDSAERRGSLAQALRDPRGERETQWYESGYAQDSFFAPDSQRDPFDTQTTPGGLSTRPAAVERPLHPGSTSSSSGRSASGWTGPSLAPSGGRLPPGPSGDAAGDIIGRR